jgi:hypothetical protein
MGTKTGVGAFVKRAMSWLFRESNHDSSLVQVVIDSLYQLSYPASYSDFGNYDFNALSYNCQGKEICVIIAR